MLVLLVELVSSSALAVTVVGEVDAAEMLLMIEVNTENYCCWFWIICWFILWWVKTKKPLVFPEHVVGCSDIVGKYCCSEQRGSRKSKPRVSKRAKLTVSVNLLERFEELSDGNLKTNMSWFQLLIILKLCRIKKGMATTSRKRHMINSCQKSLWN